MIRKYFKFTTFGLFTCFLMAQDDLFSLSGEATLNFTNGKNSQEVVEECRNLAKLNMFENIAMMPAEMINIECAFEKMTDFQTADEAITDIKVTVRCTAKISPNDLFGPCMNNGDN